MPNDRYASLNPGAAAAALHSFPQRYRAAFSADPTRDPEDLAERTTDDGRRVREVVAATGDALEALGDAFAKVLISDDAPVPAVAAGSPTGTSPRGNAPLRDLLERLEEHAKATARHIESAKSSAFLRTGHGPGGEAVSALDIARQAVRVGADNLLVVQRALRAAGVRLGDTDDDTDD